MPLNELEIILGDGWSAASLRPALEQTDTSRLRSLALVYAGQWCVGNCWDQLVLQSGKCARLQQLSIRCPSDMSKHDINPPDAIVAFCRDAGVSLSIDFVIGDTVDVPAFLLGHGSSLNPVVEASRKLSGNGLNVRWLLPLSARLVYRLDGIISLARDTQVVPVLLLPDAFGEAPQMTDVERLFAVDFITYRLLGEDIGHLTQEAVQYYRHLLQVLNGKDRPDNPAPAYVLSPGSDADSAWKLEQPRCSHATLRTQSLTHSYGGRSGQSRFARTGAVLGDVSNVLIGGVRAHIQASLAFASRGNRGAAVDNHDANLKHVLLIGAYGGEHIGDLAILGGVLRRIHDRHGTDRAVLMSQRPDHTRHLIPMLDAAVTPVVQEYTFANIRQAVNDVDGVVFAGGPLTDIPKQLVRHLYAASLARRAGKPFIVEGIGPGVLKRKASMITAKRLVSLADRISIRTSDDAKREVIRGLPVTVGRDPAFDYLETRPENLTRLQEGENAQIDDLLNGTEGRPLVGLNIRPIGDFFTPDAPGRNRAAYTREIEQKFERHFASGLRKFAAQSGGKPCFVFFPMNAIQFGMSDLRSAYRIMKHLGPGIDFRVWEADASLDSVVALIRRLDVAVTMRFHATIFALSQGCKVVGVDYRIGKRDKVASVLSDAGRPDDFCRIDELTADWLNRKLVEMTASGSRTST